MSQENNLQLTKSTKTLVDLVEEKLINYFKENNLEPGDPIPKELELAEKLGVGRSVVREALSRFRMLGIVETRTKRGMLLMRPHLFAGMHRIIDLKLFSQEELLNILGLRIAIEIGMVDFIVDKVTPSDIKELRDIVSLENAKHKNNLPTIEEDMLFHSKLYKISNNSVMAEFDTILYPLLFFIKEHFDTTFQTYSEIREAEGGYISHEHILDLLEKKDKQKLIDAMRRHFSHYIDFIKEHNN